MKKQDLLGIAIMATLLVCNTSCEKDEIRVDEIQNFSTSKGDISLPAIPTGVQPEAFSEMTQEWWRFVLDFDCALNPLNYPVLPATAVQTDRLVFLVGAKDGLAFRNITVRQDQILLAPVINTLATSYCRDDIDYAGQDLNAYLIRKAKNYMNLATNISVKIDGKTFSPVSRIRTSVFMVDANPDLIQCLDYCLIDREQKAVSDGYWVFVSGLKKGRHILKTHAEILQTGIVEDVTYNITVL